MRIGLCKLVEATECRRLHVATNGCKGASQRKEMRGRIRSYGLTFFSSQICQTNSINEAEGKRAPSKNYSIGNVKCQMRIAYDRCVYVALFKESLAAQR